LKLLALIMGEGGADGEGADGKVKTIRRALKDELEH